MYYLIKSEEELFFIVKNIEQVPIGAEIIMGTNNQQAIKDYLPENYKTMEE